MFWPDAVKQIAGCVVHIRQDGGAGIERGLARESERPEASNDNAAPAKKARPALSTGLVRDLTAHRTAALRATLAEQPDVALDAVIYTLALPLFYDGDDAGSCLQLHAEHADLAKEAEEIEDSPAMQRILRQRDGWARQLPDADLFWSWLREQPQTHKLELLAFCAAQAAHAVQPRLDSPPTPSLTHADALHAATGIDMADWWQPTRASYLGRVSKTLILEAMTEAVSRQCADGFRERKRDALIGIAERKLSGTRWLPALLRRPAPAVPAEADPSLLQAA